MRGDYVEVDLPREGRSTEKSLEGVDAANADRVLIALRKEMRTAAAGLEFERAAELRDRIRDIEAWKLSV